MKLLVLLLLCAVYWAGKPVMFPLPKRLMLRPTPTPINGGGNKGRARNRVACLLLFKKAAGVSLVMKASSARTLQVCQDVSSENDNNE